MDFLPLAFIFFGAGLTAVFYYTFSPSKELLKERLPNKPSLAGIILWLLVCLAFYIIIKNNQGFSRTTLIFTLIFSLLVFETFFLFLIRFLKSNTLAVIFALLVSAGSFIFHYYYPTFALRNIIIILATLGASALLIKLNYLKTWLMFAFAFLWTGYDIYTTRYFLPGVLVPVTEPPKTFFFPSVITGSVSLGSGDFIFLVLFLMIICRQFGLLSAFLLLAAETAGLLVTGFFLTSESIIPFLVVMTPIFLIIYLISYIYNKKPKGKNMKFKTFKDKKIPEDIVLKIPGNSEHNTLVYIPWQDKYLNLVPDEYKKFFLKVLPQLNVRTTDVHTACSLAFLDRIIKLSGEKINRRVVALGLILHDIGWSKLTTQEITDSLSDYQGLKLSKTSLGPKEKHAKEGVKIAKNLLAEFVFDPSLYDEEKNEIIEAVKYHDDPEKCSLNGQLVADLDRLWSFTHENFWQDTVRKNVAPEKYLENLYQDYTTYFSTEAGRTIAEELLKQRKEEIRQSI